MLKELQLKNFRCFSDHKVIFRDTNIIVGKNNAGKSTIIEALRLISIIAPRFFSSVYREVPIWLDIPVRFRGIIPSLKGMGFNFNTVFHRYGSPPSMIKATFDTGYCIEVYIGANNQVFALLKHENIVIFSKKEVETDSIPRIFVLSQIAPLLSEERKLTPEYVQSTMYSPRASLHFRNELTLMGKHFETFKQLAESSWNDLQILQLQDTNYGSETPINLMIRDGDFVAEVGWMGHGLQMWLQVMWFLARADEDSIVVLDEPDVYMHADLQRSLIRILTNGQYKQILVATHSLEIMSEVEPCNVLVLDNTRYKSAFADSIPILQHVIDQIGGIHNIQLTRLWSARRCLFVEGKDIAFLKRFQNIIFPDSKKPIDIIPNMSVGGWGGWEHVIGTANFLQKSTGEQIRVYCIFDRDYHTDEEIINRQKKAEQYNISLHIWNRKEIENYLIVPSALLRVILSEIDTSHFVLSEDDLITTITKITDDLYIKTCDNIASEYFNRNKSKGVQNANEYARIFVNTNWKSLDDRLTIVSGKEILSRLRTWCQDQFGISFSNHRIICEIRKEEIESEVVEIIKAIEYNRVFPN